ncbi:hypothetical protein DPQ33_17905 [Oceanidesulfovibrio indonesiensis]|uniref:Metallo-beta-lactamase domain-containing protein n=1 Tax=Oceanidesulfovibrio indonesiensis TaxID=54767 RepID=A0A7M3MAJ1_9BACT|nr:MBL fold metallo-hydrolase [Oceanidesulfovibrio indonesiensis]TVM14040.1 hypothetical protein DPQ33_17905 [Oceanidesulfovibrio indonesiensis]
MNICIHHGSSRIGGTCIEVESAGHSIILDAGMPFDVPTDLSPENILSPLVFNGPDGSPKAVDAVWITHAHLDHYGLVHLTPSDVPIFCGRNSFNLMQAMAMIQAKPQNFQQLRFYESFKQIEIGPFSVTPLLVDHSAFDAHGFLVTADGMSICYTGDFRAHGRKKGLFERLIKTVQGVDALLMEGTLLGERSGEEFKGEAELEDDFAAVMQGTDKLVMVSCGSQNIDRVVTVFRAARQAGRMLALDLFTAHILDVIEGHPRLPSIDWPRVRVVFSPATARPFEEAKLQDALARYRKQAVRWPRIAEYPERFVLMVKPGHIRPLMNNVPDLSGAAWIYSLWPGYLRQEGSLARLSRFMKERGVSFNFIHTSGHARASDLKRFVEAVQPKTLIPVHTGSPDQYHELFPNITLLEDGQRHLLERE